MFRLRIAGLAGCLLALSVLSVGAQDTDLKALLRKTIAAHGGAQNLAKFKAVTSKFKGNMEILGFTVDVTGETNFQKPDKLRNTMALDIKGKNIDVVTVYDGKKMWVSTMGTTKEIDDEKVLKAVREGLQIEGAGGFTEFLKPPYELSAVGEVKVKDKDAVGIRVSKKGQPDFSLFIDKKTHLLLKTEMRTIDSMGAKEVTQEKFILDYQDKNGLKVARRVEIHNDGKLFMTLKITDTQAFEKLDDSLFAMP